MNRKMLFRLVGLPIIAVALYFVWKPVFDPARRQSAAKAAPVAVPVSQTPWGIQWKRLLGTGTEPFAGCCGAWLTVSQSGEGLVLDEGGALIAEAALAPRPDFAEGGILLTEEGGVRRIDRAGKVVWSVELDGAFASAPVSAPGHVFILSQEGRVFCLERETGKTVWMSEETGRSDGGLAVGDDVVAFGNCNANVYLLRMRDGKRLAEVPLGEKGEVGGVPLIAFGRVYAGTSGGEVVAVGIKSRKIEKRLRIAQEQEEYSAPICRAGLSLVTGTKSGAVVVFDPDMKEHASLLLPKGEPVECVTVLPGAGDAWVGAGGTLFRIDTVDMKVMSRFALGDTIRCIMVSGDRVGCFADDQFVVLKAGVQGAAVR